MGAGAAEGAMDASTFLNQPFLEVNYNVLEQPLAEHRKFIERILHDRRFQSVKVEAPSVEDTVLILKVFVQNTKSTIM